MSHYSIDELIARWKKEELTAEQAIGQILLALKELEGRLREQGRQPNPEAQPNQSKR